MKKKLCKNRKQYSLFKVALYSSEGNPNSKCSFDTGTCNTKIFCGLGDKTPIPPGANVRCNPPESTQKGAYNIRCNMATMC
jgi:hypothetical protein